MEYLGRKPKTTVVVALYIGNNRDLSQFFWSSGSGLSPTAKFPHLKIIPISLLGAGIAFGCCILLVSSDLTQNFCLCA